MSKYKITLNGKSYEIEVEALKEGEAKAAGDAVKAGEAVVVLEAMKMENDISSPKDGVIKSIAVNKGDTVASGQFLFEVE